MANEVTSKRGRIKMAQAHGTTGAIATVTQMAFGSGGVGVDGVPIPPDENADPLTLGNALLVKNLDSVTYPVETTVRFTCTLGLNDLPGAKISEIALMDSEGDIVAKKTFGAKDKDSDTEMIFEWDEQF